MKINTSSHLLKFLLTYSIVLFFLKGCIFNAEEFVAPSFNTTIYLPISDTTFTLLEFVDDDSSIVASDDPDLLGLLYYVQSEKIKTQKVGDNLNLESAADSVSKSIGNIKTETIPKISALIFIEDWVEGVISGVQTIIPETSSYTESEFDSVTQFEYILFETGQVKITVHNILPVPIEVRGFELVNIEDNSIFIEWDALNPIKVAVEDSASVLINIAGRFLRNNLRFEGTLYTIGSNGQIVSIPSQAGTRIEAELLEHTIQTVRAKLPAQLPVELDSTLTVSDSTYFESTTLDGGSLGIILNSYLDLVTNITLEFRNLYKPDGSFYTQQVSLAPNEKNRIVTVSSLKNWSIESSADGILTNKVNIYAKASIPASNNVRVINNNDSLTFKVEFNNLSIQSLIGRIKPTIVDIPESFFGIDLGDLEGTFTYDNLNFADSYMALNINSSIGLPVSMNGFLTASNGAQKDSFAVPITLAPNANELIDISDYGLTELLNSFTGEFPDSFKFSGSSIVNNTYEMGDVNKSDSIAAEVELRIPLDLGISGGIIADTVKIDSTEISEDDINSIESMNLTFEFENSIPFSLELEGYVLDENGNNILTIPPDYSTIHKILIPAPNIDENGFVSSPSVSSQKMELNGEDAGAFLRSKKMFITFMISTPPRGNNDPVKFKSTDFIRIKISGEIDYLFNNSDTGE